MTFSFTRHINDLIGILGYTPTLHPLVRALWGRLLPATVISPNEQLYKSPKTCFNQVLGLRMLSRQEDLKFGNARGIRK